MQSVNVQKWEEGRTGSMGTWELGKIECGSGWRAMEGYLPCWYYSLFQTAARDMRWSGKGCGHDSGALACPGMARTPQGGQGGRGRQGEEKIHKVQ